MASTSCKTLAYPAERLRCPTRWKTGHSVLSHSSQQKRRSLLGRRWHHFRVLFEMEFNQKQLLLFRTMCKEMAQSLNRISHITICHANFAATSTKLHAETKLCLKVQQSSGSQVLSFIWHTPKPLSPHQLLKAFSLPFLNDDHLGIGIVSI